ncbi:MAG: oxidoreductase [Thaumarchaeota archaeon]|jgi:Fe-S-cluster-containing dehydrogenase component|nr:oxidoreductase [Nitrososphaerota archaeon]
MVRWALVVDITKCNGCYNCFLACKDEFWDNDHLPYSSAQPRHGHYWMNILSKERGQYPHVRVAYLPLPCMHCDNAPCIEAAKDGAIYKRPDGIVIIDPVKAFNQKQILNSCPYNVIFWNEEKKIPQKCTFCAHLLDNGWKEPRCVQACPTKALIFGDLDDPKSEVYKAVISGKAEQLKPELGANPRVYYIGLYKYNKLFVAGSVVFKDVDECAEKVKVMLQERESGKTFTTFTNVFGDFEFDGLDPGNYSLSFEHPQYRAEKLEVKLERSTYIGYVFLEKT